MRSAQLRSAQVNVLLVDPGHVTPVLCWTPPPQGNMGGSLLAMPAFVADGNGQHGSDRAILGRSHEDGGLIP